MFATILTLITLAPASFAHGPMPACEVDLRVRLKADAYARYLLEDGVIAPVAQVERVLKLMSRVRERDLVDQVLEKMGPAARVLPRVGDMIHLSEQLTQVNRGYQALQRRCARISNALRDNRDFVDAVIARSESVLDTLAAYLDERPGRDTAWVHDQIGRIHQEIDRFRTQCLNDLPPQSKGFLDLLDRILSP